MSEWKEYRLGDIADCSLGKMLDQRKNQGLPRPYLNNVSLRWGSFNIDNTQTMLFEDSELERFQIKKNDIVMCEGGEPGRCAVWTEESPICYQKALHRIRVKEGFDNWFVYYYLRQFVLSGKAKAYFTGTTILHLPLQALKSLEIKAPDIEEQRRIASILSSLDDKIAINRRICENLEAQAQALFKHWFIDFAPFKDGKFVESELGMIPEGWRVGKSDDFYIINIGKTPPRAESKWFSEDKKENKIWISISDMGACSIFISDSKEYLTPEAQQNFNVIMVPAGTVLLSFKLTIGRVAIADTELTTNEAIARFILPCEYYREYTYLFLKQYKYGNLGSTSSIATAVNSKIIKSMPFLMPTASILMKFSETVKGMFDEIKVLNKESSRLSTLRDTLLPKLMSGEIKV